MGSVTVDLGNLDLAALDAGAVAKLEDAPAPFTISKQESCSQALSIPPLSVCHWDRTMSALRSITVIAGPPLLRRTVEPSETVSRVGSLVICSFMVILR